MDRGLGSSSFPDPLASASRLDRARYFNSLLARGDRMATINACSVCVDLVGTMFIGRGLEVATASAAEGEYRGPYLGQEPPQDGAVLFAPRLFVRENESHDTPVFSNDGRTLCWVAVMPDTSCRVAIVMREDGTWSGITPYPYAGHFRPDGMRRYFHRTVCPPGGDFPGKQGRYEEFIWFSDRVESAWSEPQPVSAAVNRHPMHWQFGVASNDNLYFSVGSDLACFRCVDDVHQEPELLVTRGGATIRGGLPYVAPDESYLIFVRFDERRRGDLFVTFRNDGGSWSEPRQLEGGVNTDASELCPAVSPDGRYLFYISDDAGFFRPYWVPSSVMDSLRDPASR
jgi:hypothetical protein